MPINSKRQIQIKKKFKSIQRKNQIKYDCKLLRKKLNGEDGREALRFL